MKSLSCLLGLHSWVYPYKHEKDLPITVAPWEKLPDLNGWVRICERCDKRQVRAYKCIDYTLVWIDADSWKDKEVKNG